MNYDYGWFYHHWFWNVHAIETAARLAAIEKMIQRRSRTRRNKYTRDAALDALFHADTLMNEELRTQRRYVAKAVEAWFDDSAFQPMSDKSEGAEELQP